MPPFKPFTHPTPTQLTFIAQQHYKYDAQTVGMELGFCAVDTPRDKLNEGDYIELHNGWTMVTHFNAGGLKETFCVDIKTTGGARDWHHFFVLIPQEETVPCVPRDVVHGLMNDRGVLTALDLPPVVANVVGTHQCCGSLLSNPCC